jgi:hypothetical protein
MAKAVAQPRARPERPVQIALVQIALGKHRLENLNFAVAPQTFVRSKLGSQNL